MAVAQLAPPLPSHSHTPIIRSDSPLKDMEQTTVDDIFELQSRVEAPPAAVFEGSDLPDKKLATETTEVLPFTAPSRCLTFIKRKNRYYPEQQAKLKNSLLAGVGFLELANAGDFAANVWNEIPVPIYAIVLMAIGGTLALGMLYFAVKDALLSWQNICGLREERRYLRTQRALRSQDKQMSYALDSLLDVNFRETGTELVDRIGMDTLMGFGCLLVGVGTYMAIDGADPDVFIASNLLSGYIGNAPCVVYGLVNLLWSAYVWRRARRHSIAGTKELGATRAKQMLKMRTSSVQLHGALNGITGVVAGAASVVTATMWWGYVALAPCIITSVFVNYLWRHRIGYDRPFFRQAVPFNEDSLVAELVYVDSCRQRVGKSASEPLSGLVSDPRSISCVIEFIMKHQLFEEFCIRVLGDMELSAALFDTSNGTVTIDAESLAATDDVALSGQLLEIAQTLIIEAAPKCFNYQERYLLEALGCYMCNPGNNEDGDARGTIDERRTYQRLYRMWKT